MSTVRFGQENVVATKSLVVEMWEKFTGLFRNSDSLQANTRSKTGGCLCDMDLLELENEAQKLCNQAVFHLIPMAGAYQQHLMDTLLQSSTVYAPDDAESVMNEDTRAIEDIKGHVSGIQYNTKKMCEADRKVKALNDSREKAVIYHHSIKPYIDTLRFHISQLEGIIRQA